jgi:hypothetical protein
MRTKTLKEWLGYDGQQDETYETLVQYAEPIYIPEEIRKNLIIGKEFPDKVVGIYNKPHYLELK